MDESEKWSRYFLGNVPGIGPKKFKQILEKFPKIQEVVSMKDTHLLDVFGIFIGKKIVDFRSIYKVSVERRLLEDLEIKFKVFGEVGYPKNLSNMKDPPQFFYYKGEYSSQIFKKCIAVVGTRKVSEYGRKMTRMLSEQLSKNGFIIVSGMAYGVDREAHLSALDSGNKTIAVLASSVDNPTPKRNEDIYKKIEKNGLVISEMHPKKKIEAGAFPKRNRIIAGLSIGTIVVEAPKSSGALITADIAFRENRQVFAVPGDVGKINSAGTNNLIKVSKAKLVEKVEDIIEEFGYLYDKTEEIEEMYKPRNEIESHIIDVLSVEPLSIDELTKKLKVSIDLIGANITILEVEGVVKRFESGKFHLLFKKLT